MGDAEVKPGFVEIRGGPLDGQVLQAPPEPDKPTVWNVSWRASTTVFETHGYKTVRLPEAKHLVMVWVGRLEPRDGKSHYVRLVPPLPGSGQ